MQERDIGYVLIKVYMFTGPTEKATNYFHSFWYMVWYKECDAIVMLTNLQEPSVSQRCYNVYMYVL